MCKNTEVRVPERVCLSSAGNLCTKRCTINPNILKRVIKMVYAWFLCITASVHYLRKWDLVFSTYKDCREFYTFIIIVFLGERKKKMKTIFPITLSVYLFQGYKSMSYILVMCCESLLQLLYLQSFTEIGITVHRIYQQNLRSGPQTKIRICVFFWKKLLSCQQCFYDYFVLWEEGKQKVF